MMKVLYMFVYRLRGVGVSCLWSVGCVFRQMKTRVQLAGKPPTVSQQSLRCSCIPTLPTNLLFLHLCSLHIDCSIRAAAAGSRVCLRQSVPVWVWPLGEPGYAPMTSHGHSAGWHVTHMHSVSDTHWERHGQADHQLLYRGKWNALNLIASIMCAVTARDQLCEGFHPCC